MKRTYICTKKFKDLTKALVKEWNYTDVTSFDIIERGQEVEDIEKEMFSDFDECKEYLILHFSDGSQATFRGSYVDMFILEQ